MHSDVIREQLPRAWRAATWTERANTVIGTPELIGYSFHYQQHYHASLRPVACAWKGGWDQWTLTHLQASLAHSALFAGTCARA